MRPKNINDIANTVNNEFMLLSDWFKANKLSLHVSKTNCIIFTGNKRVVNIKLEINEMEINQQKHVKFLGVVSG